MSDYTLEVVTRKNISYAKAEIYSRIKADAFRNDMIAAAFETVDESLADNNLPPFFEYEKLRQKLNVFQRNVQVSARQMHLSLLSDDRQRIYLYKNKSDEYVGASYFVLPKYAAPTTKLNLFQWIKYLYLKVVYKLKDLRQPWPSMTPFMNELLWAKEQTGISNTQKTFDALKASDSARLAKVGYPMDYSYSICIFTVRSDQHGKGVGKHFMNRIVEDVKTFAEPPTDLGPTAPAKIVLQSVPSARGFYEKIGYLNCGSAEHTVNGHLLQQSTYFLNL